MRLQTTHVVNDACSARIANPKSPSYSSGVLAVWRFNQGAIHTDNAAGKRVRCGNAIAPSVPGSVRFGAFGHEVLDGARGHAALGDFGQAQQLLVQVDIGANAADDVLVESAKHAR